MQTLETLLEKLFNAQTLTKSESQDFFTAIVNGQLSNEQLAAALLALKIREETTDEIAGAVIALQQDAKDFDSPEYRFADIVGTGGDGANTINISTASALVGASLSEYGLKIAKHGNHGVSSQSGSSDVLAALGVDINVEPADARQALDDIGICFLFAQKYHLGYKNIAPVRAALKTRTIFNNLGPLINPAKPKRQLLGVYSPELIDAYARIAVTLGHEHTLVVHGSGIDEVALHGVTQVAEVKNGTVIRYEITPSDFGFKEQPLSVLAGGTPKQNAQDIIAILSGHGNKYHNQAVAMNTAMLMKLFGYDDIKKSTTLIMEHLAQGRAMATLEGLRGY